MSLAVIAIAWLAAPTGCSAFGADADDKSVVGDGGAADGSIALDGAPKPRGDGGAKPVAGMVAIEAPGVGRFAIDAKETTVAELENFLKVVTSASVVPPDPRCSWKTGCSPNSSVIARDTAAA